MAKAQKLERSSKKQSITAMICCGALVAALGIGGAIAYLTDTDTATNEFTAVTAIDGGVTINEPDWVPEEGEDVVPGKEVVKNPRVTNNSDTDVWTFIEVKVPAATDVKYLNEAGDTVVDTPAANTDGKFTYGQAMFELNKYGAGAIGEDHKLVENPTAAEFFTSDWELVRNLATTDAANADGKYVIKTYAHKAALAPGESTQSLYDSVTLLNYIGDDDNVAAIKGATDVRTAPVTETKTGAEIKALGDEEKAAWVAASDGVDDADSFVNETTYTRTTGTTTVVAGINIVNTQYSIQKEGFADAAAAWAAYSSQATAVANAS